MGNNCSCNCDWIKDAFNKFIDFFKDIGEWLKNFFEDIWKDAQWAYYIAKDVLLIAGPFFAFFLYVMLTRAEVIIGK